MLEDARRLAATTQEPGISAGISSAAISAFTGAPIGGSVNLELGKSLKIDMVMKGWQIWAAQYRMLDT